MEYFEDLTDYEDAAYWEHCADIEAAQENWDLAIELYAIAREARGEV